VANVTRYFIFGGLATMLFRVFAVLCLPVLLTIGTTVQVHAASVTYDYAGANYSTIVDVSPPSGSFTNTMSITGSMTINGSLGSDLTNINISSSVSDFSFNDGRFTFNPANVAVSQFTVSTNAAGQITSWDVELETLSSLILLPSGVAYNRIELTNTGDQAELDVRTGSTPPDGCCFNADTASNHAAGTFTVEQISGVPEPSTWASRSDNGALRFA
jgi:hypothetical protein